MYVSGGFQEEYFYITQDFRTYLPGIIVRPGCSLNL